MFVCLSGIVSRWVDTYLLGQLGKEVGALASAPGEKGGACGFPWRGRHGSHSGPMPMGGRHLPTYCTTRWCIRRIDGKSRPPRGTLHILHLRTTRLVGPSAIPDGKRHPHR